MTRRCNALVPSWPRTILLSLASIRWRVKSVRTVPGFRLPASISIAGTITLAKSISDAAWGQLLSLLRSYGRCVSVPVIAISPRFTSQDCSGW